jgi:hypothetical protein
VAQATAVGVLPAEESAEASQSPAECSGTGSAPLLAAEPQDAPTAALNGAGSGSRSHALRFAAEAVLEAWDDEIGNRAGLPDAIAAMRLALAGARARKPREGTKQEQVLAMPRRAEGATIAQVIAATGWEQHTVRGFFAGLKKRQGITVDVLERVRQVGPDKQGAKGSYSVYRIADVG